MKKLFLTSDSKLQKYHNTLVEVIKEIPHEEFDFEDVGPMFMVKAYDGFTFDAFADELVDELTTCKN